MNTQAPTHRTVPGAGAKPLLVVDIAAPAFLALYVVLSFQPFALVLDLPGFVTSGLFPALGLGVVLLTPSSRLARIPVDLPLVCLILWSVASVTWTLIPHATTFLIRAQLLQLAVLVVVMGTMSARVVHTTLVVVCLVVGCWSLASSLTMPDSQQAVIDTGTVYIQRGFRGGFTHKNDLGVFMVYALGLALSFRRGTVRLLLVVLSVTLIIGSRSATAAAGLFAVTFAWFWIVAVGGQRSRRERTLLAAMSIIAIVAGVLLILGLLPEFLNLYDKDVTFSGRTLIWNASLVTIAEAPWQGYGLGAVWVDGREPVTQQLFTLIGFGASHSHNGLLEVLLQLGIVGLVLFGLFLVGLLRRTGRALASPATTRYGQWAVLTVAPLLLMSVSEPLFQVPHLSLLAIIATTLAVADHRREQRTVVSHTVL